MRWNGGQEKSVAGERPMHFRQGASIVCQVLEHVEHQDRVTAARTKRQTSRVSPNETLHSPTLCLLDLLLVVLEADRRRCERQAW